MTTTIAQPIRCSPQTPRSLEVLVQHVRAEALCLHCLAGPGKPCKRQGRRGVHLDRFVQAYRDGSITAAETAITIVEGVNRQTYYRHGVATIVRDGFTAQPRPEDAPQLYVVVNVEPGGRRVTVTDPKPRADAERFAEREAPYFAGRLEVAPARPEDLADLDES